MIKVCLGEQLDILGQYPVETQTRKRTSLSKSKTSNKGYEKTSVPARNDDVVEPGMRLVILDDAQSVVEVRDKC